MRLGYQRPIYTDQDIHHQLNEIAMDEIFQEQHGLAKKRVALESLFEAAQPGDTIYFQNLVVLADSTQQLIDALRIANKEDFTLIFIDEGITSEMTRDWTLLDMLQWTSQLQSRLLSQSTTFSLQQAKAKGTVIGRPKKSQDQLQQAFDMYDSGDFTLFEIKEQTGISKSTLYRYLDERASGAKQ